MCRRRAELRETDASREHPCRANVREEAGNTRTIVCGACETGNTRVSWFYGWRAENTRARTGKPGTPVLCGFGTERGTPVLWMRRVRPGTLEPRGGRRWSRERSNSGCECKPGTPVLLRVRDFEAENTRASFGIRARNTRALDADSESRNREHSHSRKSSPRTLELRRSRICLDCLAPGRYILRG